MLDNDGDISKDEPSGSKAKTPVNKTGQGSVIGARIVSTGLEHEDVCDQEELLIKSMNMNLDKLLTATEQISITQHAPIDGEDASFVGSDKGMTKLNKGDDLPFGVAYAASVGILAWLV